MAYSPIEYTAPHYEDHITWWLKAYEQGTTTPVSMATDATAATLADKFQIGASGFIVTAGGALVIPHLNTYYDLWLFPTATEADNNDTSSAIQLADNIAASAVSSLTETIFVDDYIATGVDKTTTDVSAAFNTAFVAAEAANAKVVALGGVYYISNTVYVITDCDIANVTFEWHGGDDEAVAIAADDTEAMNRTADTTATYPGGYVLDKRIALGYITNADHVAQDGWITQGVGLFVSVLYNSHVSFKEIDGFTNGMLVCGTNAGCVYNTFHLGNLVNNKIGLEESDTLKGWANQNTFIAGRLSIESSEATVANTPIVGTVLHKQSRTGDHTSGNPNNNVYINMSIEGGYDETAIESLGEQNTWIRPRLETNSNRSTDGQLNRYFSYIRFNPIVANSTTYTLVLDGMGEAGVSCSYTSDASATSTEIVTGLIAAIAAQPDAAYWVTGGGTTFLTVTGNTADRKVTLGFTAAVQTYTVTLKAMDGTNQVSTYISASTDDATVCNGIVDAVNNNANINTIVTASNVGNEVFIEQATTKGFLFVSTTNMDDPKYRKQSAVGFQYTGDAAQFGIWSGSSSVSGTLGTKQNMVYAMGTSTGGTAKRIVWKDGAQDNKLDEASIGLFSIDESYYRDPAVVVIHEDGAEANHISHKTGSYHAGESFLPIHRHYNKNDYSPTFALYDDEDAMYTQGEENDYSLALWNNRVQTFEVGTDTDPSLEMNGKSLRFNHVLTNSGAEDQAKLGMVRSTAYPGGFLYLTGNYDPTAVWSGSSLDKDNYHGLWMNDTHWNGAVLRMDSLRMCLDSTGKNIRTKAGNEFEYEDNGFILNNPMFKDSAKTTSFTAVEGEAYRTNSASGAINVTLPLSPNALTSEFNVRDETVSGANATTIKYAAVKINGLTSDFAVTKLTKYTATYMNTTVGWLIVVG